MGTRSTICFALDSYFFIANLGINNNNVIEIGKIKFYNFKLVSVLDPFYQYQHPVKVPENETIIENSLFTTAFGYNHVPSELYQGGISVNKLTRNYIELKVTNANNGGIIKNAVIFYGFITIKM